MTEPWLPIKTAPAEPMGVLMEFPDERHSSLLQGHDYSVRVCFWDGYDWREQGTGHLVSERLDFGGKMPTRWMPLPAPPAESGQ